jgi:hypothetical protein
MSAPLPSSGSGLRCKVSRRSTRTSSAVGGWPLSPELLRANGPDPEMTMAEQEQDEVAMLVLNSLQPSEREILARFYLQGSR